MKSGVTGAIAVLATMAIASGLLFTAASSALNSKTTSSSPFPGGCSVTMQGGPGFQYQYPATSMTQTTTIGMNISFRYSNDMGIMSASQHDPGSYCPGSSYVSLGLMVTESTSATALCTRLGTPERVCSDGIQKIDVVAPGFKLASVIPSLPIYLSPGDSVLISVNLFPEQSTSRLTSPISVEVTTTGFAERAERNSLMRELRSS